MGQNIKVKINQAVWGREVMAGPEMQAFMASLGNAVSSQLPGSEVNVASSRGEKRGGVRARVTVVTDIPMRIESQTGQAQAALMRVVGNATRTLQYTTKKGKTRRATQAQIDHWTRGRRKR